MAVNITNEELDLFNKNGFTDDDVRATVENYRSQGLDDSAIRAKVQAKLDSWGTSQKVEQSQPTPQVQQPKPVKKQPLTEDEKQAEVARIKAEFEAKNKEIDREHRKQMAKLYGGALLEIGSAAIPVGAGLRLGGLALKAGKPIAQQVIKNLATRGAIEGSLSGLIGGVGRGMVEDKDLKGIGQTALTDAGIGLVGGAGLGAIGGKIATNVGKTGQRIKNIEAKQLAKTKPQVTKEVKAEVVEQPIKQVEEVVESVPQDKYIGQKFFYGDKEDEIVEYLPQFDMYRGKNPDGLDWGATLYKKEDLDKYYLPEGYDFQKVKAEKDLINQQKLEKQIAKENLEKQRIEEYNNLDDFGSELSDMQLGKIRKTLNKQEVYNGELKTNKQAIKDLLEENATPDIREYNGKKEYIMRYPNGSYITINKTKYDYAKHLQNKTQQLDDVIPEQVVELTAQPTGKMKKSTLAQKAEKSDEVAQAVKENPPLYEAITNAETTAKAQSEIAQDMGKVHADIVKKLMDEEAEVTALDVEKARQLFGELQKQGRFDEATSLLELTSKHGSKLGQAVQAFSLWSKTTPEGAMLYAQKLLDKYNKGVKKKLQKQLTEKELREIGDAFKKLNESGLTGRDLEVETAKAMKKVFKVVPKTFAQKLEGYRYINMLLSGKSRIKDFLLTGKNASDIAIDEAIAGGIDIARSALSKDKTRYVSANPFVGIKAWFSGAKRGLKEGVEDVRYGMNTSRSGEVGRYGLPNNPTFEEQAYTGNLANKALTFVKNTPAYAEKLLRYSLQVPDRMFFEARFASSIANQMKARGLKEPTEDMINSALKEAKRAVYQEDRPITKAMLKGAELADVPIHALEKSIGLPQGTLPSVSKGLAPFVKTPTNVIAQGAEGLHGLGSGSFQLRNAIESGNPEAIRQAELLMGRGIRGLGELGLGLAIGKGIWDNVKTNVGNKDYYANEITGLKPSSVVIGDKGFSLQNMQTNLPIVTGIGLGQRGLGQAWTNTADVIAEMPALKALGDLNKINKEANYIAQSSDPDKELIDKGSRMLRSLGASYLSSLVPVSGFLGELRNDIDPYARELYVPKGKTTPEMLANATQYVGNRIVNRLPFASETLPIKYNSLGQPVMINNIQNPVARALSEAVDFGVRNYNDPPQEMVEMQRLKDFAMENDLKGKTTLTFDKPKKYIGRGKDRIDLTNEQYSELTRLYNGKVYEELQFLMNTPEYMDADEETQIKWVKEVLKEKKKEAEDELFDIIK